MTVNRWLVVEKRLQNLYIVIKGMEAIILTSLYTAVGRFERRSGENGKYPVVIVNGKEHMVEIPEMFIWTCCSWRILELPRTQIVKGLNDVTENIYKIFSVTS